jgi:hypothetical protein
MISYEQHASAAFHVGDGLGHREIFLTRSASGERLEE